MSVTLNNSLLRITITRTIIFHLLTKTLSVGLSMVIGPENVRSVTQRPTNWAIPEQIFISSVNRRLKLSHQNKHRWFLIITYRIFTEIETSMKCSNFLQFWPFMYRSSNFLCSSVVLSGCCVFQSIQWPARKCSKIALTTASLSGGGCPGCPGASTYGTASR